MMGQSTSPEHAGYPQRGIPDPVRMPSLKSYWTAFKRQFWFAFFWSLPILVLVIFLLGQWPKEYSSTAMMLFDPVLGRTEATESSLTAANRLSSTYTARFQDPDFLQRLAHKVEGLGYPAPQYAPSSLKKVFAPWLPDGLEPASWSLTEEQYVQREQVENMSSVLKADSVPAQFQLSMTAKADNPEHAQLLAREAVNFFIVEELTKQRDKLLAQSKQLSVLESSMLREKAAPGDVAKTEAIRGAEVTGSKAERRQMKTQEQSLITAYLAKQGELTRVQGSAVDRRLTLEAELNNLLSRKGLEHPDVIQKRREIDKSANDPAIKQLEEELQNMRAKLNELQLEMKKRGIAIDRSVQISGFPDEIRRILIETSNQIRNLEIEVENLDDQIANPEHRTRYVMVREPERPTTPSDRKKFLAAAGVGGALVVLSFFLIMIVRELSNPYVTDAEVLQSRYGLPIVSEMRSGWTQRTPLLQTEQVRELRGRLRQLNRRKVPELMLLDSYRYLQQLLGRAPQAQIVLILDLSEDTSPFSLALNLANVMATDNAERILLLSFQNRNSALLGDQTAADLMGFLGGSVEWKECRMKASDTIACDVAIAQDAESNLDVFREDVVKQLLTALRDKYQKIMIDGFVASYLYENGILWRLADAVILQVGVNQTKKVELDRLLQVEDEAKVRAVILKT